MTAPAPVCPRPAIPARASSSATPPTPVARPPARRRPLPASASPRPAATAPRARSRASASPAALANECASGFCEQGVCCGSSCTGTCKSCALPGPTTLGTCSNVPLDQKDVLESLPDDGGARLRHRRHLRRRGRLPSLFVRHAVRGRILPDVDRESDPAAHLRRRRALRDRPRRALRPIPLRRRRVVQDQLHGRHLDRRLPVARTRASGPPAARSRPASPARSPPSATPGSARRASAATRTAAEPASRARSPARSVPVRWCRPARRRRWPASARTQAASTCGTDGTCDGSGACRLFASGTVCVRRYLQHRRDPGATAAVQRHRDLPDVDQRDVRGRIQLQHRRERLPHQLHHPDPGDRLRGAQRLHRQDLRHAAAAVHGADTNTTHRQPARVVQHHQPHRDAGPAVRSLTIRYWFTGDGAPSFAAAIDFAANSANVQIQGNMTATFVAVYPHWRRPLHAARLQFSGRATRPMSPERWSRPASTAPTPTSASPSPSPATTHSTRARRRSPTGPR